MKIEVGKTAPDFTLYNSDKNAITLSDHHGKNVLLLFFPFAFTSTCTKELCAMRDDITTYNNLNAEIFGISVDSPYVLKKYKEDQNLNFNLLSDFNKSVSDIYGCLQAEWGMQLRGVSKRASFVIDKNGIVRYAEILDNSGDLPDFDAIKNVLEGLVTRSQG
ncbi:MAG: redoxin domain-containing protein [Fimbriimonadaceae bacterium]|nr:redoxin domain-containing protein [Chitinophagales bacterium]